MEHRANICGKHRVKNLVALLGKRRTPLLHAGVIEGDVEPPVSLDDRRDRTAELLGVGHIGFDETGASARVLACRSRLPAARDGAADDRNIRAVAGKGERGRPPDPGRSASEQHRLVLER